MKNLNIKALLINHLEKIVFGLFAVIVLGILAGGTSWARYSKTPDELKRKVENAKTKITSNNPWPKDKEESFKVIDFSEKANLLFSMPSIARYDFSQWLFHPLYKKDEPKREPTYEAVQYLIANSTFVPLSVMSEEARKQRAEESAAEGTDTTMPSESTEGNDEFGARTSGGTGSTLGRGLLGEGGSVAKPAGHAAGPLGMGKPPGAATAKSASAGSKKGPASSHNPPGGAGMPLGGAGMLGAMKMGAAAGMMPGMPGMPGSGMMTRGGMASDGVAARGVRVMAVRGLFPIQKQIDNYRNALHVTQDEAAGLLEITDFVLERQAALPGPDPWKDSQWVRVNTQSALDVLDECTDLDFEDPVPTALRDAVITLDLPLNLLGFWKSLATHPLIKNEELSGEALEEEAKLLEKVNEVVEGANLTDGSTPRRKGLAIRQKDFKKMVGQVNANSEARGMMDQIMKGMKTSMSRPMGGGGDSDGARMPGMGGMMSGMMGPGGRRGGGMPGASPIDRLVARRNYLLFRYFDFDVEFGMAYRYRVRLELVNPNFERSVDELGDIEIAKGEFRMTPWSNISNPDVVRNKAGYFLKDVEREPYRDDKVKPSTRPVALLSMYEWDTNMGTVFSDVLNLTAIGGFVGELKKGTLIPDLVAGTLEKGDHNFVTLDALVDVESDVDVPPEMHPDLKLSPEKNRSNARLGLLEEALVVTAAGELRTLGQPMNDYDKDSLRQWKQREEMEHRIIKAKETAPVVDPAAGEDAKPKSNPRSRGRGGMMSMTAPPGMGGMPGGMGAPPGGGQPKKKGGGPRGGGVPGN